VPRRLGRGWVNKDSLMLREFRTCLGVVTKQACSKVTRRCERVKKMGDDSFFITIYF
jgi:hypothetical protein